MLRAMEQIRQMRGGEQAHLMRCSDGDYDVVKFQNNPQHRRVLMNELLRTRLAGRSGLPTAPVSVVDVPDGLIRLTTELCMETPRTRIPCAAGLQFGSRYPSDPRRVALHGFLPDEKLCEVDNLRDFAGMLVFDEWTCNTNGRQTVFLETAHRRGETAAKGITAEAAEGRTAFYHTMMIDQGFCFHAREWNFPDAPLRANHADPRKAGNPPPGKSFSLFP